MSRYDVFISYSRQESLWRSLLAQRLAELASDRNLNVFVDENAIPVGDKWPAAIERAIEKSTVVAVLASRAWNRSKNCREELRLARVQKKKIVWTSIDGSQPKSLSKLNGSALIAGGLRGQPDPLADAAMTEVCEAILSNVDPFQTKVQRALPRKYRVIRKLGEGSTCAVYLAADRSLDRRVTVRIVKNPKENDRFDEAIRKAARIGRHPSFIAVYGAWLDEDPHCCVMEYLPGSSLAEQLKHRTWRWNAEDTVNLIIQIGEAMAGAHGSGFHHRDLRPSKILINDTNRAFILGVASPQNPVGDALLERVQKADGPQEESEKQITQALSNEQIAYLVPEHCYPLDENGTDQADQYLLGLIAYHVLNRETPSVVQNHEEVKAGEMPRFRQPAPLYERVSSCPRRLSEVIERMMMISPQDRYASLAEALNQLRSVLPVELTLVTESYQRCIQNEGRFFRSFYKRLLDRCEPANALFRERGFFDRRRSTKAKWKRQHDVLKESLLLLIGYRRTQQTDDFEPNLLTRIAGFHTGELKVKSAWYDEFVAALLETVSSIDSVCHRDELRRPFILQAWRSVVDPGIRYLKAKAH